MKTFEFVEIADLVGNILYDADDYFHSLDDFEITVDNTSIGHYEFGSQKLYDKGENLFTFNNVFSKEYDISAEISLENVISCLEKESIPFNRKFFDREYEIKGRITFDSRKIGERKLLVLATVLGKIKELAY